MGENTKISNCVFCHYLRLTKIGCQGCSFDEKKIYIYEKRFIGHAKDEGELSKKRLAVCLKCAYICVYSGQIRYDFINA